MDHWDNFSSPLGNLILGSDGKTLTRLIFSQNKAESEIFCPVFPLAKAWLTSYFEGRNPGPFPVPLSPKGTAFQQRVWALLREIPYGECRTYGELARQLSPSMSSLAVGTAIGKNPIAIVSPCHRVLGAGGQLTGYAWGLSKKQFLLDLEQK